ncbi:dihydroxyacetone kinase subunit L [uncultured Roseobacter sp.]|uniref:dihydroxyacetone kinase subunit L n=1 Tax=uncultured Roseobacter sp. TaxID=114847 RepID=UPI002620CB68|nr:dihydroxyacetone kinase subunit L [uncultured Roseobacter sp.]
MRFSTETLKLAIERIADRIDPIGAEMNRLDGQLGDGDLGVTLVNGFNNLKGIKDDLPDDLGRAFFAMAKSVTAVSGSSFGTLLATALMAAGKQVKDKDEVEWSEVPALLQAAQDAMIARGGANLGDKTMLDMMDSLISTLSGKQTPEEMLAAAQKAAAQTLETFRDQPNKIGRARVYAEKSIGLDDPGMMAIARMIDCFD